MAGLLILPGRLLGPDSGAHDVVALSATTPRPVQAASVPVQAAEKPAATHTTAQHRAATPVHVPLATPTHAVKVVNVTLLPAFAAKPKTKAKTKTKTKAKAEVKRVVVSLPGTTHAAIAQTAAAHADSAPKVASAIVVPVPAP